MNFRKITAAVIILALLASVSGCANNENEVLAMVRDKPIERWYYELYVQQKLNLYQQYTGVDLTRPEYAEELKQHKINWLEDLIGEAASLCKAEDMGFGNLSPEEEAKLDNKYKTDYQQNVAAYMAKYGTDEAARRKAENEYDAWLKKNNLTSERIMKNERDLYIINKYFESLSSGSEITDEEIKAEYDDLLSTQKAACDEDVSWFGDNPQVITVYYPEGYVNISRLIIPFREADYTKLTQSGSAAQAALVSLNKAVEEEGNDSPAAKRMQRDFEKAMSAYNNMLEKAYENIRPLADNAISMLDSGKSPESIAEELGQGISVSKSNVCEKTTSLNGEMVKAVMELDAVGKHTDVIRSEEGLSIAALNEFIQARTVTLEEISDKIRDNLLTMRAITESRLFKIDCISEYEDEIVRYLDKL